MNLLKKIKIELWVLFLIGLLSLILAISTGILVRQELVGSSKFGIFSKTALFLAEIPMNLKTIYRGQSYDLKVNLTSDSRFQNISEFQGKPLNNEIYLLLSRYDGNSKRSIVELVDLRNFEIKKTWNPNIDQINTLVDTSQPEFEYIDRDHNANKFRILHPILTEDGGLIFKHYTPLIKIDKNSELVWLNQEDAFHHSIEQDHNGDFWVPTRAFPYKVDKNYVGSNYGNYLDDQITKVSADGEILFQKSVSNILIENNLKALLFTKKHFIHDPMHLNDIQPILTDGQYWKRGDVFLSLRHLSMIILYRPSTNKILWKSEGNISSQHDVNILDDHRISIFNNNAYSYFNGNSVDENNQVIIYNFSNESYSKYLNKSLKQHEVRTITEGRSMILGNNDLFVEESNYGRLLYFNEDASLQWQYVNRAKNDNVYLLNWSRIIHKSNDINKVRKILKKGG